MSDNLCLAVNYLELTESTRQMWAELDRHLEEFDCRLVLLSTTPDEPPLPFPVLPIPYLIRDYAGVFPAAGAEGGTVSPREMEWLAADSSRAQTTYAPAEALPGLLACRQVARTLLKTLQPGCVLTW